MICAHEKKIPATDTMGRSGDECWNCRTFFPLDSAKAVRVKVRACEICDAEAQPRSAFCRLHKSEERRRNFLIRKQLGLENKKGALVGGKSLRQLAQENGIEVRA